MTDPLSLQTLIDRATISDQVYRYTKGLDTRDWELIASLFSNPFHLHAQMLDVDRMMSLWEYIELGPKKFLPGFDVTAHLNTNQLITVEGNLGYIETRMYACHYINPDETISADQLSAPGAGIHCNMQMPWEAWLARQPDGDWLFHKIRMGVATSEGNSNAMETALSRHKD